MGRRPRYRSPVQDSSPLARPDQARTPMPRRGGRK
ncbi:hypothetical protein STRAU_2959 [Streptomyces aurantiacus JA 4570]|uniref:Uncharacterized protein n=1 Tax=Streptomyces aurantiacus JA 4570 TaxID=1286094 RepID=S3ZK55_9ACTN|nr:hypothetical protein STRAU_2959 [Streptomyces aurantiacus JA 4570]